MAADKWLDLARPFDDKRVSYFFGPAKPPNGESVTLRATGSVLLHISRGATSLPGMVRIVVTAKSRNGTELTQWTEQLNPIAPNTFIRRLEIPGNAAEISIIVIDTTEGGPTGFLPYTLILEAWPLSYTSIVAISTEAKAEQDKIYASSAVEVKCQMVTTPSRRLDYTEAFESLAFSGVPVGVSLQKLISAGGYLRIEAPMGLGPEEAVEVRLLTKHSGDGPFEEVCPPTVLQGGSSQSLEAIRTRLRTDSIWRLEFRLPKPLARPGDAKLNFARERDLSTAPALVGQEARWNLGRGLICFNRTVPGQGVPHSANAFAGRMRLNVTLPSEGSVPLSPAAVHSVEAAVLHAASLWVHSCLACRPDNLSVVVINGRLYVSDAIAGLGGPARGVGEFRPPFEPSAKEEKEFLGFLGNSRVGILTPFTPYRHIKQPKSYFDRVCIAKLLEKETPAFKQIQDSLCTDLFDPSNAANIRVSFKRGNTSCGRSTNIIGCRVDDELTEFNVRDYRFSVGPDAASIGQGLVEVDLLEAVLHEMGHWIGLDHIDQGESIMASSLEQARCIDFDTVKTLAETTFSPKTRKKSAAPQPFLLRRTTQKK